jgi:hypothetical protein
MSRHECRLTINFVMLLVMSVFKVTAQQGTFRMNGYLINMSENGNADSILMSKRIYNSDTILIEETAYNYSQEQPLIVKIIYNTKGKIAERYYYHDDSSYFQRTVFTRNSKGDLEEQNISEKGDTYKLKHINAYDNKGRLVSTELIMTTTKELSKNRSNAVYDYDSSDNLITLRQYIDRKLVTTYKYSYNEKKQLIEEKHIDAKTNRSSSTKFMRNELNMITLETDYEDEALTSEAQFVWHGKLLLKSITNWLAEGTSEEIIYFFEK